jgi:hypothetical protein
MGLAMKKVAINAAIFIEVLGGIVVSVNKNPAKLLVYWYNIWLRGQDLFKLLHWLEACDRWLRGHATSVTCISIMRL